MAEAQETNGWGPGNQTNKCDIPAIMETEENAPPKMVTKQPNKNLAMHLQSGEWKKTTQTKLRKSSPYGQGRIRAYKKLAIVLQLAKGEKIATQRVGDTHGLREREANDQTQECHSPALRVREGLRPHKTFAIVLPLGGCKKTAEQEIIDGPTLREREANGQSEYLRQSCP